MSESIEKRKVPVSLQVIIGALTSVFIAGWVGNKYTSDITDNSDKNMSVIIAKIEGIQQTIETGALKQALTDSLQNRDIKELRLVKK